MNNKIIFIVGPTSSGKTDIAIQLAKKFNGELISADSRQVYMGLDIGTGKEGNLKSQKSKIKIIEGVEYIKSHARYIGDIPQYLIDITEPGEGMYNLAFFLRDSELMMCDIWKRGKLPIVAGGTGLYVSALLKGYQLPKTKKKKGEWREQIKPDFDALVIGLDVPRQKLYEKIDRRLKNRMDEGLIAEVQGLIASGVDPKWLEKLGLEYRFVTWRLQDKIKSDGELFDKLRFAIHHYARRQLTWLRHQIPGVEWVRGYAEAEKTVNKFLRSREARGE